MTELRHRPAEAVPVPDHQQAPDSPHQPERQAIRQLAVTDRPAKDNAARYDADAELKHPVAKPDGYLRESTGNTVPAVPAPTALRAHTDWTTRRGDPDLTWQRNPADAPPLREVTEADSADTLRAAVEAPDIDDPRDDLSPNGYGDLLTRPDGTQVPCLDGPPRREDTRQGWAGDCGIIAALGAVAAHRPDDITRRIKPQEDGTYQVTLSEARQNGGITEPTGRDVELTVTPKLPVRDDNPTTPACAKIQDGTSWCAVMEKAFAGVDRTWTPERRADWENDWAAMCAHDQATHAKNPHTGPAPTGYVRLNQGTTPWERAEALTQLTGQPAVVREFPRGRDEWTINRIIRDQLTEGKPVLVDSRAKRSHREVLPHNLKPEHVYEITGVEQGKVILRNPWNEDHPEPMETDEFARNMNRYYSTLM